MLSSIRFQAPRAQRRWATLRHKVVTASDAVSAVQSGDTVGIGGFVAQNSPEGLLKELADRFLKTGEPRDLTVFFGGGPGDSADKGVSHFGHEGMVKRAIGAHYGQVPRLAQLVIDNKIEGYNLPLGSIGRMMRAQAAAQPGFLTRVGTGTMVDPVNGGGKLNDRTVEDLVIPVDVRGHRYLLYKALPINVAFIRGTTADAYGNISMEKESLYADNFSLAMATHNSGGCVIAQVERLAEKNTIPARNVHIPGSFVDAVVISEPADHHQSYFTEFNPFWAGHIKAPQEDLEKLDMNVRKIVARRAAMELRVDDIVNLGIGMPDGVANVASEENILRYITLTTEPGIFGGTGAGGRDFGPASNYEAIIDMSEQFDFYNGGGLTIAFLGMAEVNPGGDINVTRFGKKLTGPGGFIDITQCTPTVVFCGTFTAGGLEITVGDGKLSIVQEGRNKKFVKQIQETSFSAKEAVRRKQRVLYITERCVFELTPDGLALKEVAPGISVEKDILPHMDFTPLNWDVASEMDSMIFDTSGKRMGLKKRLTELDFWSRLDYNAETNRVMLDLSGIIITTQEQIDQIDDYYTEFFSKLGKKAHVVVNYERFDCRKSLVDNWTEMAKKHEEKNYLSVQRCVSGTFIRAKMLHGLQLDRNAAAIAFHQIDKDNTGYLDFNQVKELYKKTGRFIHNQLKLKKAFDAADTAKLGKLSWNALHDMDKLLQRGN
eukprot:TRINITY_DN270_c0_g1_i1.p1 TRINITY_DN270_c0_g1~~TRINITY_DN270_c0_g1_i1.p1  ORF type:complete len:716 (+),score=203.52 TRINITY_DN270_c0_g1_i1:124-2271(+)